MPCIVLFRLLEGYLDYIEVHIGIQDILLACASFMDLL